MDQHDWTAAEIVRPDGRAPLVLVCEHASNRIPPDLADLGLSDDARRSHIAWDIGALDLARGLSARLDAPLVAGGTSRLVYDLNRPLDSPSAIPERSEAFEIPGNSGLDAADRAARHDRLHTPFHAALSEALTAQETRAQGPVDLVTIHSFTPVFNEVQRKVQLGFLFHEADALARAALLVETGRNAYRTELNAPYGPEDGVTHTLALHGDGQGRRALMVEVANDLIDTTDRADAMAEHLAETLRLALGVEAAA